MRAAFAVFDRDSAGVINAEEFREMLPLLAGGEPMPFVRVEALFRHADKDRSGVIEFDEFAWLLANLHSPVAQAGGKEAGGKENAAEDSFTIAAGSKSYVKSVDELRADRLRQSQQDGLAARTERLRIKVALLSRASQLLHQSRPLVCAELLMRLHKSELEEARALVLADPTVPEESADGLLLRGTPALLRRRAEVRPARAPAEVPAEAALPPSPLPPSPPARSLDLPPSPRAPSDRRSDRLSLITTDYAPACRLAAGHAARPLVSSS